MRSDITPFGVWWQLTGEKLAAATAGDSLDQYLLAKAAWDAALKLAAEGYRHKRIS